MPADLSDFQSLFDQNIGRQAIITFSSGKTITGNVKAVNPSFVELENPTVYVFYVHIGCVEFRISSGWNRLPSES